MPASFCTALGDFLFFFHAPRGGSFAVGCFNKVTVRTGVWFAVRLVGGALYVSRWKQLKSLMSPLVKWMMITKISHFLSDHCVNIVYFFRVTIHV